MTHRLSSILAIFALLGIAASLPAAAGNIRVPVVAVGSYYANESKSFAARQFDGANYVASKSDFCLETDFAGPNNYSNGFDTNELCEFRNYFVFDLSAFAGQEVAEGAAISLELPGGYSSQSGTYELRYLASGGIGDLGPYTGLNSIQDTGKAIFDGIAASPVIGSSSDPGLLRADVCAGLSDDDLFFCQAFPPYNPFSVAFDAGGEDILNDAFGGYLVLGGLMTGPGDAARFTSTNDWVRYANDDPNFFQASEQFLWGDNRLFLTFSIPTPGVIAMLGIGLAAVSGIRRRFG